jgi:signal transduction histidine kinase/CheY-like chemotaxis protein
MSVSEQAFWGQLTPEGAIAVLLSPDGPGEKTGVDVGSPAGFELKPGELEKLRAGQVTKARLEGPDEARSLYLVAVPLQRHEAEPARVIVVGRRRTPYSAAEVSLLAQMLFVFEEVLQRKRAEISLREKERQLRRVQRMEALGTLAGGVAHDFNNILGVIIANGEMIELFHLDGNQPLQAKTRAILAAAYRGRDLVNQILSFSRKDSEEVSLFTVSPIIKETVKFLTASLPANIHIEHDIGKPEPPVLADPTKVHQVLMNLCTNAAHAIGGDGGTLDIRVYASAVPDAAASSPENLAPGRYLVLQVGDTGTGIRPEHMERIFEPFFHHQGPGPGDRARVGRGRKDRQGLGRGRAGRERARQRLGVRVFLPAGEADESAVQGQIRAAEVPTGTGSILFVDDEAELAKSYGEFLRSLGYRVYALTDGEEALAVFERDPEGVDLVITDYSMPGMNGDRLARKMLARRPTLPVILCTGYSQSFSEQDAAKLGIREYLKKPVSLRDVAVAIRKYLRPGIDAVGLGQAGAGAR